MWVRTGVEGKKEGATAAVAADDDVLGHLVRWMGIIIMTTTTRAEM